MPNIADILAQFEDAGADPERVRRVRQILGMPALPELGAASAPPPAPPAAAPSAPPIEEWDPDFTAGRRPIYGPPAAAPAPQQPAPTTHLAPAPQSAAGLSAPPPPANMAVSQSSMPPGDRPSVMSESDAERSALIQRLLGGAGQIAGSLATRGRVPFDISAQTEAAAARPLQRRASQQQDLERWLDRQRQGEQDARGIEADRLRQALAQQSAEQSAQTAQDRLGLDRERLAAYVARHGESAAQREAAQEALDRYRAQSIAMREREVSEREARRARRGGGGGAPVSGAPNSEERAAAVAGLRAAHPLLTEGQAEVMQSMSPRDFNALQRSILGNALSSRQASLDFRREQDTENDAQQLGTRMAAVEDFGSRVRNAASAIRGMSDAEVNQVIIALRTPTAISGALPDRVQRAARALADAQNIIRKKLAGTAQSAAEAANIQRSLGTGVFSSPEVMRDWIRFEEQHTDRLRSMIRAGYDDAAVEFYENNVARERGRRRPGARPRRPAAAVPATAPSAAPPGEPANTRYMVDGESLILTPEQWEELGRPPRAD